MRLPRNFSFFEIDNEFTGVVLKSFKDQKYKGRKIVLEIASKKYSADEPKRKEKSGRIKHGRKSERRYKKRKSR